MANPYMLALYVKTISLFEIVILYNYRMGLLEVWCFRNPQD